MDVEFDSGLLLNVCKSDLPTKNVNKYDEGQDFGEKSFMSSPSKKKEKKQFNVNHQSPNKNFNLKKKHETHAVGKSGLENIRTSSLFKSNPQIPTLNVSKQKGLSEPLFSKITFDDLNLHPHLVSCLKNRLEVTTLTKVQEKTIPLLLDGRDSLVKSCTGSGKTLAYAVPIVQKLQEISPKIKRCDGIFSLVVVPSRELALQCYECFSTLTNAFTWIVPGYLIGGEKKKSEKARLRRGINILICTLGRLLDHLEHTACLTLDKVKWLVIDEADKLLEQDFENSVTRIVSKCQNSHQTILLSATLSKGVERLAGMSLVNPVHIDVASGNKMENESEEFLQFALPKNLKQSVVVVPSKLRLTVMSAYIIDNFLRTGFKGLIFMCSLNSVDFHYTLFSRVLIALLKEKGHKCKFYRLHGNMKQEERTQIFTDFKSTKRGILLCTDVAARGLDLPHVDWILQYSAPLSPEIYVHRVGRTARIGKQGNALLFLLPSESKFSVLLTQHKIEFEEIDASKILQSLLLIGDVLTCKTKLTAEDCATSLQTRYEHEVYAEDSFHECAKQAFASYVQAYASYPKHVKDILPFKALHLGHVAKSFCLREAPSDLGCRLPSVKRPTNTFRKSEDKKPNKRKVSVTVSEYDSGFAALKQNQAFKSKKRKYR